MTFLILDNIDDSYFHLTYTVSEDTPLLLTEGQ